MIFTYFFRLTKEKYLVKESVRHSEEHALTVWRWPLRGTLVERFNPAKGQQGIRIQGERGQDVWVSADGEVVYSGDSLRGYGNLIIVKHSEEYLSAYTHNDAILVSEGDMVKQGQTIAKLGGNLIVAPVYRSLAITESFLTLKSKMICNNNI